MNSKSGKVYIYNYEQAYFYISSGVFPINRPEIHPTTNKVYFTFNWNDVQEVYKIWCNNKK
ncbi:TPA: hypothetical protein ACF2DD_002061 [Clostridium perfringens]